ncbi:hypothetical protein KP509_39G058100 [Ceratopteris richardii]|uniref:Uncharacterized protein n=1 Tax=Ceratopteris richardii TaxID=49495 RepID=A0A8T2Q1P0_CERRI|nr:hypothetical protein KP509_39G058100 [Ceratopteris richardii]
MQIFLNNLANSVSANMLSKQLCSAIWRMGVGDTLYYYAMPSNVADEDLQLCRSFVEDLLAELKPIQTMSNSNYPQHERPFNHPISCLITCVACA